MSDIHRSLCCLAVVLGMGAGAVSGQANTLTRPRFVERPGVLEFSGRMIVRPLQPDALARRGLEGQQIASIRSRASDRLRANLVEHVSRTDEFIVRLAGGETEDEFAARLMASGDYEYVEPDWWCHPTATVPDDPSYFAQWHHQKLDSPGAWDHVTGDADVVIAIVDGGVALDHPDLSAGLVPGYNAADRIAQASGGDVYDVDGHGTFIAGIVGAIGNNGVDVVGIGWNLSIMPVRYYNSPGGGFLSDLLDGARWAADHGARCVNVSQTGVENPAVQTTGAYVRSRGALLLYAAGNGGQDLSSFDWPDVLVVGGTDQDDALLDDGSVISAHGVAVDVFAPAADILSTFVNSTGGLGLGIGSGTSAAVAMASGLCGLVWSIRQDFTSEDVEGYVFAGCDDLGSPGEDPYWGWGRIHSSNSVSAALETETWVDLGSGLSGANGIPALQGGGAMLGNDPVGLELTEALPSTAAFLCIGLAVLNAPLKGGVLVPDPALIVSGLTTDGSGDITLASTWPQGIPSSFTVYYQFWITDAAGAQGFAASNALSGTTP